MKVTQEQKTVNVNLLCEFPNNPNRHSEYQIKELARSIERYGQYYPIVVDENMQILCGHGKKLALESLGIQEAKVVIIRGLSEKQKMKLVLEDNKIQNLSSIRYDIVDELIKQIGETDILGYSDDYIKTIIEDDYIVDNNGTDFSSISDIKQNKDEIKKEDEIKNIKENLQKQHILICPHCGKEIVL